MPVTSAQLTAGYAGNFYENGQPWAGAQGWTLERETTVTEEGALDQKIDAMVEQKIGYNVKVSSLIIDSRFSQRVLDADATGTQLRFLFIGERRRVDGQIERLRMDGACISTNFILAQLERGNTPKRDITFKLDTVPDFAATIS